MTAVLFSSNMVHYLVEAGFCAYNNTLLRRSGPLRAQQDWNKFYLVFDDDGSLLYSQYDGRSLVGCPAVYYVVFPSSQITIIPAGKIKNLSFWLERVKKGKRYFPDCLSSTDVIIY